jgi:polyisoprenoid-binding protein YceI
MTTTVADRPTVSGYVPGTWKIDPVHSDISFTVRHMMVSKVRGHFGSFSGEIVTAENPFESSAVATIDVASVDTGNEQRDNHLRTSDFFDIASHPTMSFRSTGVRQDREGLILDGELTLRGVTRSIALRLEVNGFGPDAYGGTRAGFTATGEINRRDFGVNWNAALESGGVVVSDKVQLNLEIEAVLDQSSN